MEEFLRDENWFAQRTDAQRALLHRYAEGDLFRRHLAVWLCEHAFLQEGHEQMRSLGIPLLAYEHLISRAGPAAAWLAAHFELEEPQRAEDLLHTPSRSTKHSTEGSRAAIASSDTGQLLTGWMEKLDSGRVESLREGLETFTFTGYTAEEPMPQDWLATPPWE